MFLKQANENYGDLVFTCFFPNLGDRESVENDDIDFQIFLDFERAIVAK